MTRIELPLPEMPAPARTSSASDATWLVRVSAFRDPVAAAGELARMLRIDLPRARMIAVNAPGVLVSGLPRIRAEQIAAAVRELGVKARVEDVMDPGPLSSFPPPPASSHPPAPNTEPRPAPERAAPAREERGGFWAQVPVAFVAPFLGQGALLLLAAGFAGLAVAVALVIPFFLIWKLVVATFFALVAVGVVYETFDRLAQSATLRDDDEWVGTPISRLPSMSALCFRGLVMSVMSAGIGFAVVALIPVLGDVRLVLGLLLLSYLYWPMALTVMSIRGSVLGLLDVVAIARGVAAAPLEYLTVCVASFVAIAGATFGLLAATGLGAGLGVIAGAGLLEVGLLVVGLAFAYYAGMAYLHGVLGYLMGSLVRAKSERFEFMLADA